MAPQPRRALKHFLAVLGMRADPFNEHKPIPVLDFDDKSVVIAFDVEDDPVFGQEVRRAVSLPNVMGRPPSLTLNQSPPSIERPPGVCVALFELFKDGQAQELHRARVYRIRRIVYFPKWET